MQITGDLEAVREQTALGDVVGRREIDRPSRRDLIMRDQVRGLLAGPRQIPQDVYVALAHMVGAGGVCVIHMLRQ